jgi:hypothetical protein
VRRPSLFILLVFSFVNVYTTHAVITPVNYPTPVASVGAVSGDIMNIDPVNNNIQIKDDTGIVQTVHVDDQVQITRRGETVRLVNLSLGDFVTVTPK